MKIAKEFKEEVSVFSPEAMPVALQEKLNGMSINAALKAKLIDDLGDDNGDFIWNHADDDIKTLYGIVQGFRVTISDSLRDNIDDLDGMIGKLVFTKGVSEIEGKGFGKPFFRLGMPKGIRLGKSVASIKESHFA